MSKELEVRARRQMFSGQFFRREALANRFRRRTGSVFVRTPLTAKLITIVALVTIVAIAGVLGFGRITPYVVSSGALVPQGGVLQVLAPRQGIVSDIDVKLGERVASGQVLFTMTVSPSPDAALKRANRSTDLQRVAEARTALSAEEHSLQARHAAWLEERKNYENIIALLDAERRSRNAAGGSAAALRLLDIGRERSQIEIQLIEGEARQTEADIRAPQILAQLRTTLEADEAILAQDEPERLVRITAARDGVLSNILPLVGDTVAANSVLAIIASTDTKMLANVLLPSKAVDYANAGDHVQVRLRDFPVERYGTLPGRISDISQLPATREELDALHVTASQYDPLFKATVVLDQQFMATDGVKRQLHSGMLIDVEIGQTPLSLWSLILHDRKHPGRRPAI